MDFQDASAGAADDDEPPYVEIPKINVLALATKVGLYHIYHRYVHIVSIQNILIIITIAIYYCTQMSSTLSSLTLLLLLPFLLVNLLTINISGGPFFGRADCRLLQRRPGGIHHGHT